MIVVEGWVRLQPGETERLREAAVEMMKTTRASEPGCLEYAFAVDLAEPDLLRVIERWTDQAALDARFASPHMPSFNRALAGAKIIGISIKANNVDQAWTLMGA